MTDNPLLNNLAFPVPFLSILPEHIEPAIDTILLENRQKIDQLLEQSEYTWDNLMRPFEAINDRLSLVWSVVSHLQAVCDTHELRAAYNANLPKLATYNTDLLQNKALYRAIKSIVSHCAYSSLNRGQKKVIKNKLRDFQLFGIALPDDKKKILHALEVKLTRLTATFDQNVLDSTQAWCWHTQDETALLGLPKSSLDAAMRAAKKKQQSGWLITLDAPSYHAVMTYADNRALREIVYHAYVTRASDQSPSVGHWDNGEVMQQILSARQEISTLLEFDDFTELSLIKKMADSKEAVLSFLYDLLGRSLPKARAEYAELKAFAKDKLGLLDIAPWDIAYCSEKLRQDRYKLTCDMLRPYFPDDRVLSGLFDIINRLYGITIEEHTKNVDVWHPDVRFFMLYDASGCERGGFYLDLYVRDGKRDGAWMDEHVMRRSLDNGERQNSITFLVCNFDPPAQPGKPALLTHQDVLTLFHEMGHGLHHMLTQIDYPDISGINGVPWDAVEFPSQFMEHFAWQEEGVALISQHVETSETLPVKLLQSLRAARHFQAGMSMLKQLELSLFDFHLHQLFGKENTMITAYKSDTKNHDNSIKVSASVDEIYNILAQVRARTSVTPKAAYNRFPNAFSHIFTGLYDGYAAGYYSYLWAEVIASDAFAAFEEAGIFNQSLGTSFLHNILEQGGLFSPDVLFKRFRGRPFTIDAFLRHVGIA